MLHTELQPNGGVGVAVRGYTPFTHNPTILTESDCHSVRSGIVAKHNPTRQQSPADCRIVFPTPTRILHERNRRIDSPTVGVREPLKKKNLRICSAGVDVVGMAGLCVNGPLVYHVIVMLLDYDS